MVVNKRKMIRSFLDIPIPEKILDRIVKNAFKGPSAGFSQGIEMLILDNSKDKERYLRMYGTKEDRQKAMSKWPTIEDAPVFIVILSHKETYLNRYAEADKGWMDKDESRWPVPYWDIDAGMAGLLVLLTVVDSELGAVFTGVFDQDYFRKEFNIPEGYTAVGSIAIGYPAPNDEPSYSLKRGRRDLNNVIHYNNW